VFDRRERERERKRERERERERETNFVLLKSGLFARERKERDSNNVPRLIHPAVSDKSNTIGQLSATHSSLDTCPHYHAMVDLSKR
jgi:hypothetical protein